MHVRVSIELTQDCCAAFEFVLPLQEHNPATLRVPEAPFHVYNKLLVAPLHEKCENISDAITILIVRWHKSATMNWFVSIVVALE